MRNTEKGFLGACPDFLVRIIEAADELNDERAEQFNSLRQHVRVILIESNLLHGFDEGKDQSNPLFVGFTTHQRRNGLFYFLDLVEATELKSFCNSHQDFVPFLLGNSVVNKYLHMLHDREVIFTLKTDFF